MCRSETRTLTAVPSVTPAPQSSSSATASAPALSSGVAEESVAKVIVAVLTSVSVAVHCEGLTSPAPTAFCRRRRTVSFTPSTSESSSGVKLTLCVSPSIAPARKVSVCGAKVA